MKLLSTILLLLLVGAAAADNGKPVKRKRMSAKIKRIAMPEVVCNTAAPVTYILTQTAPNEIYRPNGSAWKGGDTVKFALPRYSGSIEIYGNVGGDPCRKVVFMPLDTTFSPTIRFKHGVHNFELWGGYKRYGLHTTILAMENWQAAKIHNMETYPGADNGFYLKTQPVYADPTTWYGGYPTMDSLEVFNCRVNGSGGESFYVGHTEPDGVVTQRVPGNPGAGDTVIIPIRIANTSIHDCYINGAGWDGIQLANSRGRNKIYNDTVINYGFKNVSSQQCGIFAGGNCTYTEIHHNLVRRGTGNGMESFATDTTYFHDNILDSCGYDGTSQGQHSFYANDYITDAVETNLPQTIIFNNNYINMPPLRGAIRLEHGFNNSNPAQIINNRFCLRTGETVNGVIYNFVPGSTITGNYIQCGTTPPTPPCGTCGFILNTRLLKP